MLYKLIMPKSSNNIFLRIKKSTLLIYALGVLALGFGCGYYTHTNSDDREVKFPQWKVIETIPYKSYRFTHIDYLQPQYINTIENENMLNEVKSDIKKGLLHVANPYTKVKIGDGIKFTADTKIWLIISQKDPTHKFKELENDK